MSTQDRDIRKQKVYIMMSVGNNLSETGHFQLGFFFKNPKHM